MAARKAYKEKEAELNLYFNIADEELIDLLANELYELEKKKLDLEKAYRAKQKPVVIPDETPEQVTGGLINIIEKTKDK